MIVIVCVLFVLTAVFLYAENNCLTVTSLSFVSPDLPGPFDGWKIVHLSDLHSKWFGTEQNRLISIIASSQPDCIVITGDSVDSRRYDAKPVLSLIEQAVEIAPVYFVTGNHEWNSGHYDELKEKVAKCGAAVLSDDVIELVREGKSIYMAGIDDPAKNNRISRDKECFEHRLSEIIQSIPEDTFKILLSHRPELLPLYSDNDVDLVMAGHAHGGQVRLPLIGGLAAPGQGLFPKLTSGMHRMSKTTIIISRGLGNSIIPQRLFNRPEVVIVTLKSGNGI
jgi:predicted MPP superfamily phosphohydrolase